MASRLSKIRTALARAIAPRPPQKRNAFAGAGFSRLNSDWVMAASRSADQELRYELRTLRNRARELDRNSPFGSRYSQLVAENVIGPDGIRFKAKNKLKDGTDLHRGANAGLEDAWKDWSRPDYCDVTRRYSLTECLSLAAAEWATDGEVLIRLWEGPSFGPYGFMIEILDPDLLDENWNQEPQGNLPKIRQGVEFDRFGAPAAYWMFTRHPNDASLDRARVRVPADQIIHAFIPRRAGQSRGIPHAAAIMTTIKMLDGYVEAELVAARVASATMGAVIDQQNGDGPAINPNATGDEGGNQNAIPAEAEPGSMLDLRGQGAQLAMWDPQHPTSAFPDFTRMMSHQVAMGFGISYGTLTGDLSQANYGSLRVGMLDERDHWRRFQQFFVVHVLDRIYRRWLKMALLNQRVSGITDFDATRWTRVLWQPKGFDWIDPLKDVQGELIEIQAGMNSITRACASRGVDHEEILQERAEEIRMAQEYGVDIVLATTIADKVADDTSTDATEQSDATGSPSTAATAASKSWPRALRPLRAASGR